MNYSVITACLNSERTISRSIDSVLIQTKPPDYYYFVDGGSSDATIEIIRKKMEGQAFGYEIIDQKDKSGISGAWNMALARANSEIVFILNSDDWYEPGAVPKIISEFANHPEVEILISSAFFHYADSRKLLRHCRPFFMFPILMPIIHPGCFVKNSVYKKLGFYETKYKISSDYDFFYRCRKNGVRFCEIREPLVNMELGGTANRNRATARIETCEIAKKYFSPGLLPEIAYLLRSLTGR